MPSIINATTTNGLVTSADNSGSLQLQTNNGTTAVTIDTSQNVGIGTTSPKSRLTVGGAGSGQSLVFDNTGNNSGSRLAMNIAYSTAALGSTNYELIQSYTGLSGFDNQTDLRFFTANSSTPAERMRITSGGDVAIGTSDTGYTTGLGLKFLPSTTGKSVVLVSSASAAGNEGYMMYSTGAGAYRFYVGWNGTISATTTTISGISDGRLKENVQDLDVGLDAIMALKPRKFDWKAGKGKDIKNDRGFIAQEFETVFPDLIDEWKDPSPEGEEPYKSVRQDLIPVLVKAIQELKAELDATKAEVQALKGAA